MIVPTLGVCTTPAQPLQLIITFSFPTPHPEIHFAKTNPLCSIHVRFPDIPQSNPFTREPKCRILIPKPGLIAYF